MAAALQVCSKKVLLRLVGHQSACALDTSKSSLCSGDIPASIHPVLMGLVCQPWTACF